MKTAK